MLEFLSQNLGTIIVATVLVLILAAIIMKMRRDKKKGGCCCGCADCPSRGSCFKAENTTEM